jgi:hypothetical protein
VALKVHPGKAARRIVEVGKSLLFLKIARFDCRSSRQIDHRPIKRGGDLKSVLLPPSLPSRRPKGKSHDELENERERSGHTRNYVNRMGPGSGSAHSLCGGSDGGGSDGGGSDRGGCAGVIERRHDLEFFRHQQDRHEGMQS